MANASPRALASRALQRVIAHGESLSEAIPAARAPLGEQAAGALVQALCYGALRYHYRLSALLQRLLQRPLRQRDRDIECLLRIGLYQLMAMDLPAHAAVHETVAVTREFGKAWASGLVNGVLRRFQRDQARLLAELEGVPATAYALPNWLLQRLQRAYPEDWATLAAAWLERAPMTLRVNTSQISRDAYQAQLAAAGIAAQAHSFAPTALALAAPVAVTELPGFAAGQVSVQDAGAQLAAPWLDCRPGMRVLDACAAPGGKTGHLLESVGGELDLTALDNDPERLARVAETMQRLGYAGRLVNADAGEPAAWWQGEPFERILLDAPCTATGVIRRHPDIRVLRRDSDVAALAGRQLTLLQTLWPLLARGGALLYCTCSVLPEENADMLRAFVDGRDDAAIEPLSGPAGAAGRWGTQIKPGELGMDGFFYARLRKH